MRKDILTYFLGKLIPMIVNLSIVVLGVRFLGATEYGKFSLIYSSMITFFMLSFGGVQQSILRFYSSPNFVSSRNQIFNSITFWMALLLSLISLPICIFYFKINILLSVFVSCDAFLFTYLFYQLAIYQAEINSKQYAITESLFYSLWFFGCSIFVAMAITQFWIGFVAMFAALLFIFMLNRKKIFVLNEIILIKSIQKKYPLQLKSVISYGFPIAIWLFFSNTFNFADRFLIQHYFGFTQAGTYSTTYDLFFKIANIACMPILLANHSKIVFEWNQDKISNAKKLIKNSILLEFGMMIFATIFVLFFGKFLFELVTKIQILNFYSIAIPIMLASFVWQIGMFIHKPLELGLKQWQMNIAIIISLGFNLIFNLIFIPIYKFEAAAFITLGSTILYVIFVLIFTKMNID